MFHTSPFTCYVLGCSEESILSAIHDTFGKVSSCGRHNPAQYGKAKPLGWSDRLAKLAEPQAAAALMPAADEEIPVDHLDDRIKLIATLLQALVGNGGAPQGGQHAKLKKPQPKIPPSGAFATVAPLKPGPDIF